MNSLHYNPVLHQHHLRCNPLHSTPPPPREGLAGCRASGEGHLPAKGARGGSHSSLRAVAWPWRVAPSPEEATPSMVEGSEAMAATPDQPNPGTPLEDPHPERTMGMQAGVVVGYLTVLGLATLAATAVAPALWTAVGYGVTHLLNSAKLAQAKRLSDLQEAQYLQLMDGDRIAQQQRLWDLQEEHYHLLLGNQHKKWTLRGGLKKAAGMLATSTASTVSNAVATKGLTWALATVAASIWGPRVSRTAHPHPEVDVIEPLEGGVNINLRGGHADVIQRGILSLVQSLAPR